MHAGGLGSGDFAVYERPTFTQERMWRNSLSWQPGGCWCHNRAVRKRGVPRQLPVNLPGVVFWMENGFIWCWRACRSDWAYPVQLHQAWAQIDGHWGPSHGLAGADRNCSAIEALIDFSDEDLVTDWTTLRDEQGLINFYSNLADGRGWTGSWWGGYCTGWPGKCRKPTVLNGCRRDAAITGSGWNHARYYSGWVRLARRATTILDTAGIRNQWGNQTEGIGRSVIAANADR